MAERTEDGLFIGCTGYQPHGRAAMRQGSLMEIQESFVAPPRGATLQKWRDEAPDDFKFSLRCWQVITHGAESPAWARVPTRYGFAADDCGFFRWTEATQRAYEAVLATVQTLDARVLLFDTPASFTPTTENRRHVAEFFSRCRRPEGVDFAWEARGVWSPSEIGTICNDVGLVPAVDPLAAEWWPEGAVGYFKLAAARYQDSELAEVAEGLSRYERAYCVLANPAPFHDLRRLATEVLGLLDALE